MWESTCTDRDEALRTGFMAVKKIQRKFLYIVEHPIVFSGTLCPLTQEQNTVHAGHLVQYLQAEDEMVLIDVYITVSCYKKTRPGHPWR